MSSVDFPPRLSSCVDGPGTRRIISNFHPAASNQSGMQSRWGHHLSTLLAPESVAHTFGVQGLACQHHEPVTMWTSYDWARVSETMAVQRRSEVSAWRLVDSSAKGRNRYFLSSEVTRSRTCSYSQIQQFNVQDFQKKMVCSFTPSHMSPKSPIALRAISGTWLASCLTLLK